MVKYHEEHLNRILSALADETRRGMLARLTKQELSVTELAAPYRMSLAAVSKHLKVLEKAKFVDRVKEGRSYRCRANLDPLHDVSRLLDELGAFWRGRLDNLESYLEDDKEGRQRATTREAKQSRSPKCR